MNESVRGFMLLEVVVAFTILALALAALLQATGTGLRAMSAAERRLAATELAENLLAEAGIAAPFGAGAETGRAGGLRWERTLTAMPVLDTSAVPGATAIEPYRVDVAVRDRNTGQVLIELRSVRLAPLEAGLR
jgi:general secretion pathway protein I